MDKRIREIGKTILESDKIAFTFLRSIVSSQAASWVDLFLGFALFAWIGLTPFLSTAIGAFVGGVINCMINYRFTFHASECPWRAVAVKYAMVWVGSLLLNSFGTQILYYALERWDWIQALGFVSSDGCFATARIIASLLVSWFWNFLLQRYFVYRLTSFDPTAIKVFKTIMRF